jgi:hypothetical protein
MRQSPFPELSPEEVLMIRRTITLAVFFLSLACLVFAEEPMAPLQGYVSSEEQPLADAMVALLNESGEMPRATTDLPTQSRFVASAATNVGGYTVNAGIYSDTATIKELSKLSSGK